jgi:hypothetical protein
MLFKKNFNRQDIFRQRSRACNGWLCPAEPCLAGSSLDRIELQVLDQDDRLGVDDAAVGDGGKRLVQ